MKNNCTLYIVRHGETEWNVKHIIQGHKNVGINNTGKKQVSALTKRLQPIQFDAIFSSDLLRTKQTADILNMERKLALVTTEALRERYFGKFEGQNARTFFKEVKDLLKEYETLSDENKRKFRYPTAESDEEMISRVITYIREIAVAYAGKKVLVVTHGGVIRILLIHLGYATYDNFSTNAITNASYVKIESDGVDFFVKETHGIAK